MVFRFHFSQFLLFSEFPMVLPNFLNHCMILQALVWQIDVIHQPAKVYIFWLHLRTRRFVKFRISSRLACRFPCSHEFPRIWGCDRIFRGWGTCRNSSRQVQSCRSCFCHNLSSFSFCSCILFAIVLDQLVKLKFWAQQVELKWLMLNRWRRLFHSSRVKLPCQVSL